MKRVSSLLLLFIFAIQACSGAADPGAGPAESPATEQAMVPDSGSAASPTPEIVHKVIPGDLPADRVNHAGDQDSSVMADKHRPPSGDRFTFGQFERPFNSNTMDVYYANIDIQDVTVYEDGTFFYGSLIFKSLEAGAKTGSYALEFDLDLDGHGDVLVIAVQPELTDWTVNGVQVWFDGNNDVGGEKILRADEKSFAGDGFETKIFDSGTGNDPDTAWVRISPDDPNTIQLAVKLSLFNDDTTYMVGVWAGNESLNPATFDLNDSLTHEQAGAALPDLELFYPIKALAEIDNTCRLNVGFTPNGSEPGLCAIPGITPPGGGSEFVCTISCGGCEMVNLSTCSCVPDPSC